MQTQPTLDPQKLQFDRGTPMQDVPFATLPAGKTCYFRFASDPDHQAMIGMSRYWAEKRHMHARWAETWQGHNFWFVPTAARQTAPSTQIGRPRGADYLAIASLAIGQSADFFHAKHDVQQLRNTACRAAKQLTRKFSVKATGNGYQVTRTE